MDNLKYLEHVVELGKVQAATTPEEMSGAFGAFNGFLGLYYDSGEDGAAKGRGRHAAYSKLRH